MKTLYILLLLPFLGYSQSFPISFKELPDQHKVEVYVGGSLFTAYFYPDQSLLKKPVLYPVLSPEGNAISRGWPFDPRDGERHDHPHHVGIWLNNGDVNGNDFWNNSNERIGGNNKYGTIVHKGIEKLNNGKKTGELIASAVWKDFEGKHLLEETSKYVFSGNKEIRIIDRTTTLKAVVPVTIADNKEGMFAIRLAKELEEPDPKMSYVATGEYNNDMGLKGEKNVWGNRSAWMNLTGEINKEEISVAIFDHPKNSNFPSHWHSRAYGLFAVNNIGSKVFTKGRDNSDIILEVGQKITFKYRVVIASKHLTEEEMKYLAQDFSK